MIDSCVVGFFLFCMCVPPRDGKRTSENVDNHKMVGSYRLHNGFNQITTRKFDMIGFALWAKA